jgi:hypothetical protein
MQVPPLTLRIPKGSPLTSEEHDENLRLLRDFADGLAKLFEIVFNADGTLKNDSVGTNSIKDRAVTQRKLDWLANFYSVASGVDNYAATINPTASFAYGDGATTSFFCIIKFTNANTGPVSLDVNGQGAMDVKKFGGEALIGGEITAGSIHLLAFDGTDFQIVSTMPIVDPGTPSNIAVATSTTVDSTAAVIPYDNTIPQNSEGKAFADLDITYTPKKATSKLLIEIFMQASADVGTSFVIALFVDSDVDAIAASMTSIPANFDNEANLMAIIDAGSTTARTYKVRFGSANPSGSPTAFVNQSSTGAKFGGVLSSSMTITEVSQ